MHETLRMLNWCWWRGEWDESGGTLSWSTESGLRWCSNAEHHGSANERGHCEALSNDSASHEVLGVSRASTQRGNHHSWKNQIQKSCDPPIPYQRDIRQWRAFQAGRADCWVPSGALTTTSAGSGNHLTCPVESAARWLESHLVLAVYWNVSGKIQLAYRPLHVCFVVSEIVRCRVHFFKAETKIVTW